MLKNYIKQSLMMFYLVITLSACAVTDDQDETPRDINYAGSDCISIRTIRDYTPLDRSNLLIEGGGRRTYLVTLLHSSFELRSAIGISFSSRDDWLCPYGGDEIVTQGVGGDRLRIRSISRLTDEQVEQVLIRYGKIEPPTEQTPAPADELEGAEVEELGETGES